MKTFKFRIYSDYKPKPMPKINKKIGIDVGLKDFVVTSDGKKYKMPHFVNKGTSKLKKL